MKKLFRMISTLLAVAVMATLLVAPQATAAEKEEEMRGTWIATVYNINFPSKQGLSAQQQKQELDAIVKNAQEMGLNAIFFQVRPMGDALYPSEIFPWSSVLTGTQGKENADGFDPLAYIIKQAHAAGIQLHAWINPLRVTVGSTANPNQDIGSLSEDNPARQHPEYVVAAGDGILYYDPGQPEVRQLIVDGVAEILDNYDVDGIHFDDYFYPNNAQYSFPDDESYQKYGSGFTQKGDWRRNNLDTLMKEVHQVVQDKGNGAVFGVSPSPLWANRTQMTQSGIAISNTYSTYFHQFADTKGWVEKGYVDYIAPQIYWEIGHSTSDYETIMRWWSDLCAKEDVPLYIGHAVYKMGDSSMKAPWQDGGEILRQLQSNAAYGGVSGDLYYGYSALAANTLGIKDQLTQLYVEEVPLDEMEIPGSGQTGEGIAEDSLLPAVNLSQDSGTLVTFSCNAPGGAEKVWVELGPYTIPLEKEAGDADHTGNTLAGYTGSFTLPEILVNRVELPLGQPVFHAKYMGKYSSVTSPHTITVKKPVTTARVATVAVDEAVTRTGPSTSYARSTPLVRGATDVIASESGSFYKLRSGIYVPKSSVTVKTVELDSLTDNVMSSAKASQQGRFLEMRFAMLENAPYTVQVSGGTVTLNLFEVQGKPLPSLEENTLVQSVEFQQVSDHLAQYTFTLHQADHYYGYKVSYENGEMVFSLKSPPQLTSGDRPMENMVVYVDAGHGGSDPGAVSLISGQPNEEDITLALALKVRDQLEQMGATVVMTRTTDVRIETADRPALVRAADPDISISIHVNDLVRTGNFRDANGIVTLYTLEHSKSVAQLIQDKLIEDLGRKDRGIAEQALALCRITQCPAILIETGFIANESDYQFLTSTSGQNQMAASIAQGVLRWAQQQQ
ncbi:MAG: family 10 glycosylhydrolase [Eubacteriales bacterium]|jgi:uncharacterized lipoprotein YddW (UPF0748 family)/N-acetylmuramoyl-L-alanine amidase